MYKLLSAACITLALSGCTANDAQQLNTSTAKNAAATNQVKNIIMVVADGMGPAYTTAYRYYNDKPNTVAIEETVFDRHLVGMASTYPARESGYITDSAAAATALATGVKTYNGAISVDTNKQPIETVLQWAKQQGKKTGVVVTSQINHATPASYLSHNESRNNYNAIADSYIDNGIKADLYLGGGWQYFLRNDRNLVAEFKSNGFHYLDSYQGLTTLPQKPVLGLFADVGLPWAMDDTNPLRLSAMTKAAVKQLDNEQGYFMLVEASLVDWAGHANDIAAVMSEMHDLAATITFLEDYVTKHPDTLVVLTADHSTGGLTIAANGKYEWNPSLLHQLKHSPEILAEQLAKTDITLAEARQVLNFDITKAEAQLLQQARYQALEQRAQYYQLSKAAQSKVKEPKLEQALYTAIKSLIDKRTNTGWTTGGHTGIDVPVFAFGHASEQFSGQVDNTDIAKTMFKLLGKH
ncbi:alkaline phosphatase [Litorilituus sediminis]|uniref:Alkaline phosphatase n=1 Tax=Litorilituus sediminis TaxID=718192 RepID=A0A4P6P2U1_9GAMM|nr:alkaline phosphatase [Litorilituus sediminis]QBG35018.1 alkaline phosphatase [Litorilituus sediminis]